MTDDEILAAADRIRAERREAAKRAKYTLTKAQVMERAAERRAEAIRRCLDGEESCAEVARDLGVCYSSVWGAVQSEKYKRRRLQALSAVALNAYDRAALKHGTLSIRAWRVLHYSDLLKDDAYMTATDVQLRKFPGCGVKVLEEIKDFRKHSKAYRDHVLGVDTNGQA